MYKGKRFTRAQVLFMVEAALSAAFDRIDSALPDCVPKEEWEDTEGYARGALETAGMNIAIIYAQLNDDGLAICDALSSVGLYDAYDRFVNKRLTDGGSAIPDMKTYAAAFVAKFFDKYKFLIPKEKVP